MRTEPNTPKQSRTRPNAQQLLLPIAAVEQSDAAYLDALVTAELPDGIATVCRWLILEGRREAGEKRLQVRSQRQLAVRLGLSVSTINTSLRRLRDSGLVIQADGDWRLRLALLVEISEVAATRRQLERPPDDPEAALDRLSVRARSGCSGAFGRHSVSVRESSIHPVSVSVSESVPGGCGGIPTATERGERDGCLADHAAWRALQTRHFRTSDGRPEIVLAALQPCFYAAVEADLLDNEPEHKIRFLAAAWDLARAVPRFDKQKGREIGVRSPAVCLRTRVERQALFRASPEGHAWAKRIVFPAVPEVTHDHAH